MATYYKIIKIQKLNSETEVWRDFYLSKKAEEKKDATIHADINKTSGKEYFNARTEISSSTFNFKIRYCEKLSDLMFNSQIYRIIYESKIFNIKNTDDFKLNHQELIIVGEFNGKYIN